jgi:hypothetical protein
MVGWLFLDYTFVLCACSILIKNEKGQAQWPTPEILATLEAKI